jgi:hypothetical protein
MVFDELPSGDTGDMVPVALPMMVVGMAPKGFDDVIVAVVPGMDVETGLGTIEGAGTDGAAMAGDGRGGTAGGGGAGMFEPG